MNILNREDALEIIQRVAYLKRDTKALWGEMNATEMLYHCNLANRQVLSEQMPYTKPTFKQWLLKILALYLVPRFPKFRKGSPRNDTKGMISIEEFENQQSLFNETVLSFLSHKGPFSFVHPSFGSLSDQQWGIAVWKHLDHHLRQFGV